MGELLERAGRQKELTRLPHVDAKVAAEVESSLGEALSGAYATGRDYRRRGIQFNPYHHLIHDSGVPMNNAVALVGEWSKGWMEQDAEMLGGGDHAA